LYVPAFRSFIVVVIVLPVNDPGLIVQLPAGKPASKTLPVATEHVGCVMELTAGAAGVTGWEFITTLEEAGDVQPEEFVTVNAYVPAISPVMDLVVPVPVIDPGLMVHVPDGKPESTTLPVATVQVGCVMVPTDGADGVTGCALITTLAEGLDVHPAALVTV
jgi:hypothetical protein